MEMTKATIITWGSEEDQLNEEIQAARNTKLMEMSVDGKTEPTNFLKIDPVTSKRFWRDQAAAEEYVAFIREQATANNCVIVSAVIEDYTVTD